MIVLQQGTGLYEPMLDLVMPLHAKKCEAQSHEYQPIRMQYLSGRYKPCEKYHWILAALARDDALWIDGDVWLCGDEDLNQLSDADVAGVRNGDGEINTGVIWFKRSEKVIAFLKSLLETMREAVALRSTEWAEQWHANQRLPHSGLKVNVLDSRWNAYRNVMNRPTEPVQIRAFHDTQAGPEQKLKRMRLAIERGAA